MKVCSKCKKEKPLTEFHYSKKNGAQSQCKACKLEDGRSLEGHLRKIYRSQKSSAKKRAMAPPNYSVEELLSKYLVDQDYIKLYNNWVGNNFQKSLAPSLDRADENISYTLANISLCTWETNRDRFRRKRLTEEISTNKPVLQFDKDHNLIGRFVSLYDAERKTGICATGISAVCSGKKRKDSKGNYYISRTAGGFMWEFA